MSFSTAANVQTYSGNRIVIEFGGVRIGLLQSVSFDDNYGLEDASGIGDIHVIEHVPSKAVHTLQVSNMVLFKGNMRDAGVAPINGDMVLQGLVFDVCIYSRDTGALMRKAMNCSYDSGRVEVQAHRILMQTGSLKALDMSGTGA